MPPPIQLQHKNISHSPTVPSTTQSHPYLTTLHSSSTLLSAFSLSALLLLSLTGFSATGPIAGTVVVWHGGCAGGESVCVVSERGDGGGQQQQGLLAAGSVVSGVADVAGTMGSGVDGMCLENCWNSIKCFFERGGGRVG